MFNRRYLCVLPVLALAACGGGDEGADIGAQFQSRADAAQLVYDQTTVMSDTSPGAMPTTGTASYSGVVSAFANIPGSGTENYYANIAMTADFVGDAVSGRMDNWLGSETGRIGGALTLSNGQITDANWSADASGRLVSPEEAVTVTLDIDGNFIGAAAEGMQGEFSGTIEFDDMTSTAVFGSVDAVQD